MDFKNNSKDYGFVKILPLLISFIFLIILFYVYIKYPFLSIDEGYTRGLLNLNLADMVTVTASDVHPPLYYFICFLFKKLVSVIGLNMGIMHLLEFPSLIPYLIILVISLTKIRKDYGLLSAGIFSLALIAMSEFFTYYLTARMYTWALLFMVIAFLFVKDILDKNDYKSWILFAVFVTLAAYTHYFSILTTVVIYIMLFVWIIFFKERENITSNLKKLFISALLCVILFIPWIPSLYNQLHLVHGNFFITKVTFNNLVYYISYAFTISGNKLIQLFSVLAMIALFIMLYNKFKETRSKEDAFLLMGYGAFVGTIFLGFIASIVYKPILYDRYILHAIGILWIAISIKLSDLKLNKTHLLLIIILISVVGAFNVYHEVNEIKSMHKTLINETEFFSGINNNDTVIIYDTDNHFIRTHTELDKVYKQFNGFKNGNMTYKLAYLGENVTNHTFVIPDDLNNYTDKNVYLMRFYTMNITFPDNVKAQNISTAQHATLYKLTLK
ncbi:hypothetical protein [Methanobrevibacter sp.]|uniref:glycosyltransferase family 39 protein n=1 Tax=Methanobrevibacter sp. TaxID=66852 RepID=UPI0038907F28